MQNTTAGLQKEKLNCDVKDSTVEELIETESRNTEEEMRMKSENDKSIKHLWLSKKKPDDEL